MRTFSTLYKQLTGVFPEVKAKNASSQLATDGTDTAAINIDDTSWGWIQALLNFVGQTPNGVPETYNASQIFNAMKEAFLRPDVVLNSIHKSSDGSDHDFIDQDVKTTAGPTFTNGKKLITTNNYITFASVSQNTVFDKLSPFLPNTGDKMSMTGGTINTSSHYLIAFYAERTSSTIIRIYGMRTDSSIVSFSEFVDGGAINQAVHVSW